MSYNLIRALGDWIHFLAVCMILHQLLVVKTAQGISRKTQELYLLVFLTRYLDLFDACYDMYNSVVKLFYICSSGYICLVLSSSFTDPSCYNSYARDQDQYPHWKRAVLPCSFLAIITHSVGRYYYYRSSFWDLNIEELFWTFSIYLETIAVLPQVYMNWQSIPLLQVEQFSGASFVVLVGLYRLLYILNWIYRAHTEAHYRHHYVVYLCGVLQVIIAATASGFYFWKTYTSQENEDEERPAQAPLQPLQWKQFIQSLVASPTARCFVFGTNLFFMIGLLVVPDALNAILTIGILLLFVASPILAMFVTSPRLRQWLMDWNTGLATTLPLSQESISLKMGMVWSAVLILVANMGCINVMDYTSLALITGFVTLAVLILVVGSCVSTWRDEGVPPRASIEGNERAPLETAPTDSLQEPLLDSTFTGDEGNVMEQHDKGSAMEALPAPVHNLPSDDLAVLAKGLRVV